MSLTITIETNNTPAEIIRTLDAAAGPVTPAESKSIAADLARLLQRHLRSRDTTNAHTYPEGGTRSHFWRKAAQSVTFATDPDGITLSVTHQGARLRYAGAPDGIKPINAAALAIPASGAAYGRLPREFSDLRLVVFKNINRAALILKSLAKGVPGKVMFWLVRKTKPIEPDPTVLPNPDTILETALNRLIILRNRKAATNV